jgi:hypothetical protein
VSLLVVAAWQTGSAGGEEVPPGGAEFIRAVAPCACDARRCYSAIRPPGAHAKFFETKTTDCWGERGRVGHAHQQPNKEMSMSSTVTLGRRLVPLEHVAFVEPFDATGSARIKTQKPFQARVVLLDRESMLTEETLDVFAGKHGFRRLSEDGIAVNPAVRFSVEAFEPAEGFTPSKLYRSRLLWRDLDGEPQSKLLLTEPEALLAIAVRGEGEPAVSVSPGGRSRRLQASSFRPS